MSGNIQAILNNDSRQCHANFKLRQNLVWRKSAFCLTIVCIDSKVPIYRAKESSSESSSESVQDHKLLLKKLSNFGICGNLLNWFRNYFTNRHQKVTVLGKTSCPIPGSILGPLLFLMYVDDLPQQTTTSSVALSRLLMTQSVIVQ
jgi:hypothetical protein